MVKVILRGNRIQEFLARECRSQNWLARKIGIGSGHMSLLVNGIRNPSPETRKKILRAFPHHAFDYLFRIEGLSPDTHHGDTSHGAAGTGD